MQIHGLNIQGHKKVKCHLSLQEACPRATVPSVVQAETGYSCGPCCSQVQKGKTHIPDIRLTFLWSGGTGGNLDKLSHKTQSMEMWSTEQSQAMWTQLP